MAHLPSFERQLKPLEVRGLRQQPAQRRARRELGTDFKGVGGQDLRDATGRCLLYTSDAADD